MRSFMVKKYYSIPARSRNYKDSWIKNNSKDKVFLDYACGNGANTRIAAKTWAKLALCIDFLDVSVQNAKKLTHKESLSNIRYLQADSGNKKLTSDSINTVVICHGMLHHLDLSYAFP